MIELLIRQRDQLLNISRSLTSELSLNEVLRRILESATELLGGQAGIIALAQKDVFAVRASYGIPPALLEHFKPLLTDIPRGDASDFLIPELNEKMRMVAQAAGMGLHQVVALPMIIGANLVGVVYIFREAGGSFSHNDRRLLQSFADQAAIAVHNAWLYERVVSEKQRMDAILRHSADGIMTLYNDLRVENVNLALARMTGVPVDAAAGQPYDRVIRWAHRTTGIDLKEAAANGWPLNQHSVLYVEGDLQHSSGSHLSVGITYAPLFNVNGQCSHIIANVRDITRFREAEEAKDTFISVISHELKTPVSLIKGYASTLTRDDVTWDAQTLRNSISVIEDEADKLAELIDNLLDVSRVQLGTLQLHFAQVNLRDMLNRLAQTFQTQTDQHTIHVDLPDDLPGIEGDDRRLAQVFSNLISNAIKYAPDGGEITVAGRFDADQVEIAVSDEGVGLDADQQDQIFDRFYRVENTLARATQGAGLGLFIVRSIVEGHGGTIRVESQPGEGASFIVALPRLSPQG